MTRAEFCKQCLVHEPHVQVFMKVVHATFPGQVRQAKLLATLWNITQHHPIDAQRLMVVISGYCNCLPLFADQLTRYTIGELMDKIRLTLSYGGRV